ncbi:hypothetical protein OIE66_41745 [Nonomuraea sp. NBC_01738]|uniref:hypothetical protein n=1 Tax=Nonomuraea sp. NBC_01738 TaxID=2976003 RepID=UPI002E11DABA|nr:hypothetical protein OIE66_41745 [Nonomuraea sp. NBC_01738]
MMHQQRAPVVGEVHTAETQTCSCVGPLDGRNLPEQTAASAYANRITYAHHILLYGAAACTGSSGPRVLP